MLREAVIFGRTIRSHRGHEAEIVVLRKHRSPPRAWLSYKHCKDEESPCSSRAVSVFGLLRSEPLLERWGRLRRHLPAMSRIPPGEQQRLLISTIALPSNSSLSATSAQSF